MGKPLLHVCVLHHHVWFISQLNIIPSIADQNAVTDQSESRIQHSCVINVHIYKGEVGFDYFMIELILPQLNWCNCLYLILFINFYWYCIDTIFLFLSCTVCTAILIKRSYEHMKSLTGWGNIQNLEFKNLKACFCSEHNSSCVRASWQNQYNPCDVWHQNELCCAHQLSSVKLSNQSKKVKKNTLCVLLNYHLYGKHICPVTHNDVPLWEYSPMNCFTSLWTVTYRWALYPFGSFISRPTLWETTQY